MKANTRVSLAKPTPFFRGLGHPILAEVGDTLNNKRFDLRDTMLLGDGDQRDIAWIPLRRFRSACDSFTDLAKSGCSVGHPARYRNSDGIEPALMAAPLADDR